MHAFIFAIQSLLVKMHDLINAIANILRWIISTELKYARFYYCETDIVALFAFIKSMQ